MKKPILLLLAGTMLVGAGNVAHAQRERPSREDRRETFRDQIQTMTPEQRVQFFEKRFDERMKTATPEQRERMTTMRREVEQRMKDANIDPTDPDAWQKMQQAGIFNGMGGGAPNAQDNGRGRGGRGNRAERQAAAAMKQMMEAAGITDFDVQDVIIAYVAEQNKVRATLFELAQAAAGALQLPVVQPTNVADTNVDEVADSRVAKTFEAYETAVKAEAERQDKELQVLDAKINYSGTPRIKAFLTLVGILDNDVLAIGGPTAVFAPSQDDPRQAGRNGRNQGRGGGQRG